MSISEDQYKLMLMRLAANEKRNATPADVEPEALEADFQDKILAYCYAQGWWVLYSRMDVCTTTPLGTPDMVIFASKGRVFIVEAKARDKKLRPAQLGVKLKLESLGHTVHVIRSMQEFLEAIKA